VDEEQRHLRLFCIYVMENVYVWNCYKNKYLSLLEHAVQR